MSNKDRFAYDSTSLSSLKKINVKSKTQLKGSNKMKQRELEELVENVVRRVLSEKINYTECYL